MNILIGTMIVFLAAGNLGFAADPSVPDAGEPALTGGGAVDIPVEVEGDMKEKVDAALKLIGEFEGEESTPRYSERIGEKRLSGKATVERLKSQGLAGIHVDPGCDDGFAMACVKPPDATKVGLTDKIKHFPPMMFAMIILHEANHTGRQLPQHMHANCKEGKYAGKPACDDTDDQGSYAFSVMMMGNVAKHCKACTDKVKEDAKQIKDEQAERLESCKEKVTGDVS